MSLGLMLFSVSVPISEMHQVVCLLGTPNNNTEDVGGCFSFYLITSN